MSTPDIVDRLTESFLLASQAHHQAFVDAGGADAEWPLWYAEFMHEDLNGLLEANMTRSELCYLLVSADREMRLLAPGSEWHAYYARFFADRYL